MVMLKHCIYIQFSTHTYPHIHTYTYTKSKQTRHRRGALEGEILISCHLVENSVDIPC